MRSSQKVSGPIKMRGSLELFKVANLKGWYALKLVRSRGIFVHHGVAYVFLSSAFGNFITDQKTTCSDKLTCIGEKRQIRSPNQCFNDVRACAMPFPCTWESQGHSASLNVIQAFNKYANKSLGVKDFVGEPSIKDVWIAFLRRY